MLALPGSTIRSDPGVSPEHCQGCPKSEEEEEGAGGKEENSNLEEKGEMLAAGSAERQVTLPVGPQAGPDAEGMKLDIAESPQEEAHQGKGPQQAHELQKVGL